MSNSILENFAPGKGKQQAVATTNQQMLRDNAVVLQLTKTKMCAFFERGKCASMNCKYAHSSDELRSLPNLTKTKICKAFMQGHCNYGENCIYAHGDGDLRVTKGIYKTQICNFFERGYCRKGDRCNHAHGSVDLRAHTGVPPQKGENASMTASQDSSKQQRNRLPLAELLVQPQNSSVLSNAFGGALAMPLPPHVAPPPTYTAPSCRTMPTPTKSVTEIASMSFSPMPSTPMWGQYGMNSMLSPVPGGDPSPMWPRDPIDVLVANTPDSVTYSRYVGRGAYPFGGPPVPPPMAPPPAYAGYPSAGYEGAASSSAPWSFVPPAPTTPPALGSTLDFGASGDLDTSGNDDIVAVDLNERLASLDLVCRELSADVVNFRGNGETTSLRHRI